MPEVAVVMQGPSGRDAPPVPLTFEDYVRDYTPLLEADSVRVSGASASSNA